MAKECLSCLIIDAEALQAGCECMSQVVKMEILNLRKFTDASPVLFECSDVVPPPEYSPVGN